MGWCWWCRWGWRKEVADIFDKAVEQLGGNDSAMRYGPAHVVWEDENWDCAQTCLDGFDEWVDQFNNGRFCAEQLCVVRQSLIELVELPGEFKREPEGFDDDSHPGDFPPPANWVMVHR